MTKAGDISCGMKTIKLLLIVFNLLFIIFGMAVVGIGIALIKFFKQFVDLEEDILVTPIIIVVVGVFILLTGVFGFFGAIRENACMVTSYATILGILFIAEFACIIGFVAFHEHMESMFRKDLKTKMRIYYNSTEAKGGVVQKSVDFIQKKFECCGVDGSADWSNWNRPMPESCCKGGKTCDTDVAGNINTEGCIEAVEAKIHQEIHWVAGVAALLCAIELLCIGFACGLSKAIKKSYEPL